MQGRDLYNLQEAYLEVYDNLAEAEGSSHRMGMTPGDRTFFRAKSENKRFVYDPDDEGTEVGPRGPGSLPRGKKLRRQIATGVSAKECYNHILSHLLDEGYANTLDSAEVILENMSEEWIENIMEGLTGKRYMRAIEKGFEHLATAREGSRTAKRKGFNLPTSRGGSGTRRAPKARMYPDPNRPDSDRPQTPSGGWRPILQRPDVKGHRSRRRARLEVPDNENRYYRNDNSPDF